MAGSVYALVTPSMPGIIAFGATVHLPARALAEANASDAWRAPEPYAIVFHAEVDDALAAERAIQALLVARRIHPRRAFYRATTEEARALIGLAGNAERTGTSHTDQAASGNTRPSRVRGAIGVMPRGLLAVTGAAAETVTGAVTAAARLAMVSTGYFWRACIGSTRFVTHHVASAAATVTAAAKILARLVAVLS